MSGYRLRALLEDAEFCNNLVNTGQAQQPGLPGNKDGQFDVRNKLSDGVFDPSSASLLRNNIWNDDGAEEDFNLEYMDLDEFLTETGLVDDQNFANLISNNPHAPAQHSDNIVQGKDTPEPQQKIQQNIPAAPVKASNLEKLLLSGGGSLSPIPSAATPSPAASSEAGVVSVTEATRQTLPTPVNSVNTSSPADSITDSHITNNTVQLMANQIVKKRKYSEDGEGLTETSVVVVPGQDGFDPAMVKFAPEELQPQPIIKKSKKQFVPEDNKDEKYWKRRNKNNVAAKRSREARRAKENQIIMRAGFLESENERLTQENDELKADNAKLRSIIDDLRSAKH